MKVVNIGISLVVGLLIGVLGYSSLFSKKQGVINVPMVLSEYYPALEAQSEIETLNRIQAAKLDSLKSAYVALVSSSDTSELEVRERAVFIQHQYQTKLQEYQERSSQKVQETMSKIEADITNRISEFARKEHYDLIFTQRKDGDVLYSSDQTDITKEFMDFLND